MPSRLVRISIPHPTSYTSHRHFFDNPWNDRGLNLRRIIEVKQLHITQLVNRLIDDIYIAYSSPSGPTNF